MSGPTDDEALAALQAALSRLTPAPDGINVAQLLFRAGQVSVSRRNWAWPCATAASTLLAAALGGVLLLRPEPQPTERIVTVYVKQPAPPAPHPEPSVPGLSPSPKGVPDVRPGTESPPGEGDYLRLRQEVLANGVDALPPPAPWPAGGQAKDPDTLLDMPQGTQELWFLRTKHSLPSGGAS